MQHTTKNPLYLNANIIYGECLKEISKIPWKRNIKTGFIDRIYLRYTCVTSILTKSEIIQRLIIEENCTTKHARNIFQNIEERFKIRMIYGLNRIPLLTDYFFEEYIKYNLSFADAVHIMIAKSIDIPLVTHDKKMYKQLNLHQNKQKFYENVYKPEELQ